MYKLVTESNRPVILCAGNLEAKIEFYSLDSAQAPVSKHPAIIRVCCVNSQAKRYDRRMP